MLKSKWEWYLDTFLHWDDKYDDNDDSDDSDDDDEIWWGWEWEWSFLLISPLGLWG